MSVVMYRPPRILKWENSSLSEWIREHFSSMKEIVKRYSSASGILAEQRREIQMVLR